MKKIKCLFKRDPETGLVADEVSEDAEWVFNGEGIATRKFDGTCCMIKDGKFYKRYDAKHGKVPPENFIPAQEPDSETGHWPGWVPVSEESPQDRYHMEAFARGNQTAKAFLDPGGMCDDTYELCGPKINGNPERLVTHELVQHGINTFPIMHHPKSIDEIKEFLRDRNIEGIVWHHKDDDRMVKIRQKDFGFMRG
jgi:hypothetical protein